MCKGIILDFFQDEGNLLLIIDKLMMWVTAGSISCFTSFMIEVSIRSRPKAVVLLKLEMIVFTWSGCTVDSLNEHCLPAIKDLNLERGSDMGGGRLDLICSNFSMKNSF